MKWSEAWRLAHQILGYCYEETHKDVACWVECRNLAEDIMDGKVEVTDEVWP